MGQVTLDLKEYELLNNKLKTQERKKIHIF